MPSNEPFRVKTSPYQALRVKRGIGREEFLEMTGLTLWDLNNLELHMKTKGYVLRKWADVFLDDVEDAGQRFAVALHLNDSNGGITLDGISSEYIASVMKGVNKALNRI